MHPSQGRSRRHHAEPDDALLVPVSRVDERRPEAYSRSHHQSSRSEAVRVPPASNRPAFSESSSRVHRTNDDWRPPDTSYSSSTHARYNGDAYPNSRHDDYHDQPEQRGRTDHWQSRTSNHDQYPSSSRDWPKRADQNYATSYSEGRSWSVSARFEENRNNYEQWPVDEGRLEREESTPIDGRHDRDRTRYARDNGYTQREGQSWRRDDRWPEGSEQKKPGWNDRPDEPGGWNGPVRDRSHPDDRAWEPAPAWKSGGRESVQTQRSDYAGFRNGSGGSSKKNMKGAPHGRRVNQGNQKRERKSDDSHMNK